MAEFVNLEQNICKIIDKKTPEEKLRTEKVKPNKLGAMRLNVIRIFGHV